MNPVRSILVGVDFTPWSAAALNQAVRMAAWHQATVHVVHAVDVCTVAELEVALAELGEAPDGIRECFVRDATAEWEQFGASVPGASGLDFEVAVGTPGELLLGRARRYAADLVVLGVQGTDHAVGAVASACLRRAGQDVLLVRPQQADAFKVVVAGVDFSDASRAVIAEALAIAAREAAALHLVHVYRGPWHALQYWSRTPAMGGDYPQRYRESMLRRLEQVYRSVRPPGCGRAAEVPRHRP